MPLDRRAGDGAVGAEDAAIAGGGPEIGPAGGAAIGNLAGDRRHLLSPGEPAAGAGEDRFGDDCWQGHGEPLPIRGGTRYVFRSIATPAAAARTP